MGAAVYLEDLANQPTMTAGRQLLQLIMAEPAVAVSRAQAILTTPIATANTAEARALLEWIETILVYKLPQLKREEIQAMLHLPDIDLKQTRFYLDAFDDGLVEGRPRPKKGSSNIDPATVTSSSGTAGHCTGNQNPVTAR